MDIEREIKDLMHRYVNFEHHLYDVGQKRTLELKLMPRNKSGLKWCEQCMVMLKRELKRKLAISIINIEISEENVKA